MDLESSAYLLVMAGGQGTRFWPESTSKKPKQYLSLTSDRSLLEETLLRFKGLVSNNKNFIVTVKSQQSLARECSKNYVAKENFIFEPSGRNTAPCILLAMAKLEAKGVRESDLIAIVPSDHVILDVNNFQKTMNKAYLLASDKNKIVTIGIKPNFPHTGYGYIHKGSLLEERCFEVDRFVEKPNFETAKKYLEGGEHYWNAGMFVSSLQTLKKEFQEHAPDMYEFYSKLLKSDGDETEAYYNEIRKDSIDYAIMEKSKNVLVLEASFDWNDLGSWDALESILPKKDGNTFITNEEHYLENAKGNIVFSPKKFVSLVDVDDLIIVDNENVLMILPKKKAQDVKNIVEYLKKSNKLKEKLL